MNHFSKRWSDVPLAVIDYESTGTIPGADKAVEVGIARFESGALVAQQGFLINPGREIPAEATAIHGITNKLVDQLPMSDEIHLAIQATGILDGAQPAAYNASFDRWFCPWWLSPVDWPWLDVLPIVRAVDRYARGKGRHKLTAACERHGVALDRAHSAQADARAAGELFYALMPKLQHQWASCHDADQWTMGELLLWIRQRQADDWYEFQRWVSRQPPLAEQPS